jgi:WD40 repeat protein
LIWGTLIICSACSRESPLTDNRGTAHTASSKSALDHDQPATDKNKTSLDSSEADCSDEIAGTPPDTDGSPILRRSRRLTWRYPLVPLSDARPDADGFPGHVSKKKAGPGVDGWFVTVSHAALSPDGKLALLGYTADTRAARFTDWVKLWDVQNGKALRTLSCFKDTPAFLAFLPDGKSAMVADEGGLLRFYDLPGGQLKRTLRVYNKYLVSSMLSTDGLLALTVGCDGPEKDSLRVWRLKDGKLLHDIVANPDSLRPLAISPDHRLAVVERNDGYSTHLAVFDLQAGKQLNSLPRSDGWFGPVAIAPDSRLALIRKIINSKATGDQDCLVLCELETGRIIWTSDFDLRDGCFLPGAQQVLARGPNHTWQYLDAATGKTLWSVSTFPGTYEDVGGYLLPVSVRADYLSLDCALYLSITGTHKSGVGHSHLDVHLWGLGKTTKLLQKWTDTTHAH